MQYGKTTVDVEVQTVEVEKVPAVTIALTEGDLARIYQMVLHDTFYTQYGAGDHPVPVRNETVGVSVARINRMLLDAASAAGFSVLLDLNA